MIRRKGFTLIELLAVIIVLGIILTITVVSVGKILNNSEDSLLETQKNRVVSIAKNWYLEHGMNEEYSEEYNGYVCITVNDLKKLGYIESSNVLNPKTGEELTGGVIVINKKDQDDNYTDNYEYRFIKNCKSIPSDLLQGEDREIAIIREMDSTTSTLDITKFKNFVNQYSPTEIYFVIDGKDSGTDLSNLNDNSILAWMVGAKMYVSAKEANKRIKLPSDSTSLFSADPTSLLDPSSATNKLADVSIIDVSYLDTSDVVSMNLMFVGIGSGINLTSFKIIGLNNWDTSNVINMEGMFAASGSGENVTSWDIGTLNKWDTSNVINMYGMFMFAGFYTINFSLDLSNWDTSNVTSMTTMFMCAGENSSTWNIGNLNNWNTSNVTGMNTMFCFAGENATTWNIGDLSNWDTSNTKTMYAMFWGAGENATTWNIGDLSNWNTSNVTLFGSMFSFAGNNATYWNIGDLSNWNTSKVTDMSSMFSFAGSSASNFNLDLSKWDTSSVTDIENMFKNAGTNAATFSIKIKNDGRNTTSALYGSGTNSVAPPSGRTFTLN